jgi:hypothetical protein
MRKTIKPEAFMSRKKSERKSTEPREGEIILYTTPDGAARVGN